MPAALQISSVPRRPLSVLGGACCGVRSLAATTGDAPAVSAVNWPAPTKAGCNPEKSKVVLAIYRDPQRVPRHCEDCPIARRGQWRFVVNDSRFAEA